MQQRRRKPIYFLVFAFVLAAVITYLLMQEVPAPAGKVDEPIPAERLGGATAPASPAAAGNR